MLSDSRRTFFGLSPWLMVGLSVVLGAAVFGLSLRSTQQERVYLQQNLNNRADAIVWALETGARMSMSGGRDNRLQTLVEQTAHQPGVIFLMMTDDNGNILADSDASRVGQQLPADQRPSPQQPNTWRRHIKLNDGRQVFQVWQRFNPLRGRGMMGGGNGMMRMMRGYDDGADNALPQWVAVGIDPASFETTFAQTRRNNYLLAVLVILLGMAGFISLFWAHHYRRSQSLLRDTRAMADEVIASLPLALLTCDTRQRIISANRQAIELLQLPALWEKHPLAQVTGLDWAAIRDAMPENGRLLEQEYQLNNAGGHKIPVSISASPVRGGNGYISGTVFVLRDLTEVKQLQAQVERQARLSALGEMAAGVAHEIRNPLSSIKGLATYLGGKFSKEAPEHLAARTLSEEVDRLNRVVSELLDFARPGEFSLQPGDITPVIERAIRLVQNDAANKHLSLVFLPCGPLPEVEHNADRLAQCLLNLVINAIQATPEGGTISVAVRVANMGTKLAVSVADNGSGIDKQNLSEIFTPYFTTKPSGTGLGLAIVHQIIEKHRGEITVESDPGSGSVFTLWLPIYRSEHHEK